MEGGREREHFIQGLISLLTQGFTLKASSKPKPNYPMATTHPDAIRAEGKASIYAFRDSINQSIKFTSIYKEQTMKMSTEDPTLLTFQTRHE